MPHFHSGRLRNQVCVLGIHGFAAIPYCVPGIPSRKTSQKLDRERQRRESPKEPDESEGKP